MFRKASFGFTAQAGLNRAKSEAGKIGWACNKQHRGAVMRASSRATVQMDWGMCRGRGTGMLRTRGSGVFSPSRVSPAALLFLFPKMAIYCLIKSHLSLAHRAKLVGL